MHPIHGLISTQARARSLELLEDEGDAPGATALDQERKRAEIVRLQNDLAASGAEINMYSSPGTHWSLPSQAVKYTKHPGAFGWGPAAKFVINNNLVG